MDEEEYCEACMKEHDVKTFTKSDYIDDSLLFAHIYVDRSQTVQYMSPLMPFGGGTITLGYVYHFRLHLKENKTHVLYTNGDHIYEPITVLTGFPITPANVKERLQTILTFS